MTSRSEVRAEPGIFDVNHAVRRTDFLIEVGHRIRKVREVTGLGQASFAHRLGVSQSTISHAEGGSAITLYLVALIAQTFDDVDLNDLVPLIEGKVGA